MNAIDSTNADSTGKPGGEILDCRRVRERLFAAEPREAQEGMAAVADHLAACAACAALARRLALARRALARPLAEFEPDAQFPARVLARIERPAELLGWAAFRALPAALGLALALAGFGWLGPPAPPPAPAVPATLLLDEAPSSDQLLAWSALSPEVWP
jgi:hypothetical protein